MDNYDYHFISIKFLSAILFAIIFAFLFIFVFTPQQREDYPVYNLERKELKSFSDFNVFDSQDKKFLDSISKAELEFKEELKKRSFESMSQSRDAMLAVITSNYLEKVNGLKEEKTLFLEEMENELNDKEEKLLQAKRKELEEKLSQQLQSMRQEIREKYSDFSQQQIRDNYLKIINLEIAIEVVASDQSEIEKYQQQLQEVKKEQQAILAEKNTKLNNDISERTRELIMEFNQNFANYRDEIQTEHQNILAAERQKIEQELREYRQEIKKELARAKEIKAEKIDILIQESKEKYY